MTVVFWLLYGAVNIFILTMWLRLFLDLYMSINRQWRPRGPMLVFAEIVLTVTDPPLKLVRRVIPPLRVGGVQLDLAWIVVVLVAFVLARVCAMFI